MRQITIKTNRRCQLLDITEQIAHTIKEKGGEPKGVLVSVPHTTAGVIINECADPSVGEDIMEHLEKMVPESHKYRHSEGNSDAHIKSTLAGTSVLVPVNKGKMVLGTWQGIFFAEFDGPRTRKINISLLN
ncbi:MAG: secondary thiamine-phosphate synthase enzyme YjbQ [Phycisphaerae bacterium]